MLHGWLREVDWESGTARLHNNLGAYVALKFDSALDDEMLQLATQYVPPRYGCQEFHTARGSASTVPAHRSWNRPVQLTLHR